MQTFELINVFSAVESTQLLPLRQMDLFKRQCIALESAILSETILPLSELKFILKNSQEQGWSSPTADWFYQYVRIESIWHDDGHLVYRTSLPLTDHTEFLRYHFTSSWPFVPESNGFTLELELPADIAYDSRRNNICATSFSEKEPRHLSDRSNLWKIRVDMP